MESVIKWQTGTPTKSGDWFMEDVIAWCTYSEIEPYKG